MSAERLLALAPALVQQQAAALKPLLENFFSNLALAKEPLELEASSLDPELIAALKALPFVLENSPSGGFRLWSFKGFRMQQEVLAELCERLQSQAGLLVTGGAGSGKTSLVKQLIQETSSGAAIALMAPTGKAAARLREALTPLAQGINCGTIHRWLEASGDGLFRRGPRKPLDLHTVVIDEFSMVETALLTALLAALPTHTRLLLLGDPGQLPPIAGIGALAPLQKMLAMQAPQCLIELKGSHRFNEHTSLGQFVQRLRLSEAMLDTKIFHKLLINISRSENLNWHNLSIGWPKEIIERLRKHKQSLQLAAENQKLSDQEALNELSELMLLAPRRKGRHGVDQLNERWLDLDKNNPFSWPIGTPLLINRNNNERGLSNGDLGLIRPDFSGGKVAVIASGDGAQRLPLELLGGVEPAFAITVHKSQGSQAKQVIVVINELEGLDPKLLYTALTRAQARADLLYLEDPNLLS